MAKGKAVVNAMVKIPGGPLVQGDSYQTSAGGYFSQAQQRETAAELP